MFHAKDGLYFAKDTDGGIVIIVDNENCTFRTKLDIDTFASAIVSVSEREFSSAHHEVAVALLKGH